MDNQLLGKGTFGEVKVRNGQAVKSFKKLRHLIQEVSVIRHMEDSPYIINCTSYSLERKELVMPVYDSSLRDAMVKNRFTDRERKLIFHKILMGVCHLHSREILHSDLKPSNILVNFNPVDAVICDLGLSSSTRFAKIYQTARGYRLPDNELSNTNGSIHDHFGLAVIGLELFGRVRLRSAITPEELRQEILSKVADATIRECLVGLTITDINNSSYVSVRGALMKIYNVDGALHFKPLKTVTPIMTQEDDRYFYEQMKAITSENNIARGKLGYKVLKCRIEDPSYPLVSRKDYPLYIASMCVVMTAIFCHGKNIYDERSALSVIGKKWTLKDIYRALYDIMEKPDLMNYLLCPS